MTQSSQMPALAPEDAGTAKTVANHLYQSFCYRGPKKALPRPERGSAFRGGLAK